MRARARWRAAITVCAAMAAIGCGDTLQQMGDGMGRASAGLLDLFSFNRSSPPQVTKIEVTRRLVQEPDQAGQAPIQHLKMDLTTGQSTYTDTDGRSWPQQIEPLIVERLQKQLSDRKWQVQLDSAPKASVVERYQLTAWADNEPLEDGATWANPSAKPLPDALRTVEMAFDAAHRYAHPLSEQVDLLK